MTDAPPPPADGTPATPPPAAPAPKPATPGSATTLFWRRPDRATLVGALTTVLIVWAIEFVFQILYAIQYFSYMIDSGLLGVWGVFGDIFYYGIWRALFFLVPVFFALWLLLPVVKESTLPVVLKRVALAGVAGLAGFVLFGLASGIVDIVRHGFHLGQFGAESIWLPISAALSFTVYALVGATIAWLRASRVPKTVPPAQ